MMSMLQGVKNAFEIIDGRLNMPDQPAVGAADEVINQFRSELEAFNKAEVAALQILTSHMSTEILVMVMRFRSAREMWLELERLFDGNSEDRMQFFASIEMDQEMTIHMSRLKTLFNDFNAEFRRLITPYTPQENGCAKRDNRTLVARVMLYAHSNLPKRLWVELVNTAAYIINRTGVSAVEGKSPFELWFGIGHQLSI